MTLSHIAHWIQRQEDELLGYVPDGAPDVRRCRVLMDGQEVEGTLDCATGTVTLDTPPARVSMVVVWIDDMAFDVPLTPEEVAVLVQAQRGNVVPLPAEEAP